MEVEMDHNFHSKHIIYVNPYLISFNKQTKSSVKDLHFSMQPYSSKLFQIQLRLARSNKLHEM